VERSHRPLAVQLNMCRKDENQRDWDQNLRAIESAIRTGTKEGSNFSRLFLKTGRDNCTPIDRVLNAPTQLHAQPTIAKALETLALARLLTLTAFADAQKERQRRLAGGHSVNDFDTGDKVMLHLAPADDTTGTERRTLLPHDGPVYDHEMGGRHETIMHIDRQRRCKSIDSSIGGPSDPLARYPSAPPAQQTHHQTASDGQMTRRNHNRQQPNRPQQSNRANRPNRPTRPTTRQTKSRKSSTPRANKTREQGQKMRWQQQTKTAKKQATMKLEWDEAAVANQNDGILREPELSAEQHAATLRQRKLQQNDVDYDALDHDQEHVQRHSCTHPINPSLAFFADGFLFSEQNFFLIFCSLLVCLLERVR
jgi:hypothetical protein